MRKYVVAGVLLTASAVQVGCVMPIYSTTRDERTRELIYTSENFRQITEIWQRIWFLDQPDLATPYRVHGGII